MPYNYITPEGAINLRNYKYSGADLSFIYTYILTPMNKILIEFFPLWMAPNFITSISLLFGILAYIVSYIYSPRIDVAMPLWVYIFIATMLFLYQTFDNLDGRQARRTNTSSPLGLLFDHGCDAFNITMSTLTIATCYCTGISWLTLHMWAIAYTPFVGATWEEYYTGSLTLGYINGPTDGILIAIGGLLLNVVYGEGLYCNTVAGFLPSFILDYLPIWLHSQSAAVLLVISGYLTASPTFLSKYLFLLLFLLYFSIYFIYAHLIKTKSSISFWDPPYRLLPFLFLFASIFLWRDLAPELFNNHPRIYFFTFGCLFCNMV